MFLMVYYIICVSPYSSYPIKYKPYYIILLFYIVVHMDCDNNMTLGLLYNVLKLPPPA